MYRRGETRARKLGHPSIFFALIEERSTVPADRGALSDRLQQCPSRPQHSPGRPHHYASQPQRCSTGRSTVLAGTTAVLTDRGTALAVRTTVLSRLPHRSSRPQHFAAGI